MILNPPRILKLSIRLLKPLTRLHPVLTCTNKRNHSLRIEATSVIDCLQEDIIQFVHRLAMLGRRSRNLIDWLKRHLAGLACKFGADLVPEFVEFV